jgi:predicted DNA-binding protein with PD1-like motif
VQAFLNKLQPESEIMKQLQALLTQREIKALISRAGHLLSEGRFPEPDPEQRSFPWPLI